MEGRVIFGTFLIVASLTYIFWSGIVRLYKKIYKSYQQNNIQVINIVTLVLGYGRSAIKITIS